MHNYIGTDNYYSLNACRSCTCGIGGAMHNSTDRILPYFVDGDI